MMREVTRRNAAATNNDSSRPQSHAKQDVETGNSHPIFESKGPSSSQSELKADKPSPNASTFYSCGSDLIKFTEDENNLCASDITSLSEVPLASNAPNIKVEQISPLPPRSTPKANNKLPKAELRRSSRLKKSKK